MDRRFALHLAAAFSGVASAAGAAEPQLTLDLTGIRWRDIRLGTGLSPKVGQQVTIDYMMTRQAGAKIQSSKDAEQPFSWVLGDGSVIEGLEIGILGQQGIPPMKEGGVRRLLIPQRYGYSYNVGYFKDGTPTQVRDLGPQPPKDFIWIDKTGDRVNSYLRFKDTYMNPMRLDEPGIIIDVILQPRSPPPQAAAGTDTPAKPPEPVPVPVPAEAQQLEVMEKEKKRLERLAELQALKEQLAAAQDPRRAGGVP